MTFAKSVAQLFCLTASLAETVAFPQTHLSFSEAIAQAASNNPLIAAADGRLESAQGLRLQASLKPNARGTIQLENYRAWEKPPFSFANSPDNYAIATQLIERGGKRERRVDAAEASVQRVSLERDLLKRQIVSRVATAYWAAASAEQIRRLWLRQEQDYTELVTYTENRFKEGVVAEADVLRAKVERNKTLLSSANAAEEAIQARVNLYREIGQAGLPDAVELDDPATAPARLLIPTMELVLQSRYELQVARQSCGGGAGEIGTSAGKRERRPRCFARLQAHRRRRYRLRCCFDPASVAKSQSGEHRIRRGRCSHFAGKS